jgi:hypothetical protein
MTIAIAMTDFDLAKVLVKQEDMYAFEYPALN